MIRYVWLLLIPLSVAAHLLHAPPAWVFITSILAIVPLADWVRRGTEEIAERSGSAIGGLLNVTFGNAPELILALFALKAGEPRVVKAQITGSIIGNGLLGTGLAILVGCWGREKLTFNRQRAGLVSSLLMLATIAIMIPALFHYTERDIYGAHGLEQLDERLSLAVSVVLIAVYVANLVYTFYTHRDIFHPGEAPPPEPTRREPWPLWLSIGVLAASTVGTAVEAELVAGSVEGAATALGLTSFFLGVIALAIVGNAAEYVAAIYFARRGKIGLALSITVGSTIQVALLAAPLLVLISFLLGHPMNLVFVNPLELIAVAAVAFIINSISQDGETTWFEGVMLLAIYLLLGLAFFFLRS